MGGFIKVHILYGIGRIPGWLPRFPVCARTNNILMKIHVLTCNQTLDQKNLESIDQTQSAWNKLKSGKR